MFGVRQHAYYCHGFVRCRRQNEHTANVCFLCTTEGRLVALSGGNVCYGSKADDLRLTELRPLHPTQRTNAEASLNVCIQKRTSSRLVVSPHLTTSPVAWSIRKAAHQNILCSAICAAI